MGSKPRLKFEHYRRLCDLPNGGFRVSVPTLSNARIWVDSRRADDRRYR